MGVDWRGRRGEMGGGRVEGSFFQKFNEQKKLNSEALTPVSLQSQFLFY